MKRHGLVFIAASLLGLLAVSCSKDPLEGAWTDGETEITFNTKEKTVTLKFQEEETHGTYDFGERENLLVKIDQWVEMGEDYSKIYDGMDYDQLASLGKLENGSLLMADLMEIPLILEPREDSSLKKMDGTWSFTSDGLTLTFTLDNAEKKFHLMEYAQDYSSMGLPEPGIILDVNGPYILEHTQYIFMNFIIDGMASGIEGDFALSKDGEELTIKGINFTRVK